MPPPQILDPKQLDLDTVIADRNAIREVLLHRYEMEQLDAICLLDREEQLIAGYRDVKRDEFWVRGHFPNYAVMPGVLMCEAAAQMGSYYSIVEKIATNRLIGFGGMNDVRFRAPVHPGDRLVLVGKAKRLRRIQTIFHMQGFVKERMVFHADVIGVALPMRKET